MKQSNKIYSWVLVSLTVAIFLLTIAAGYAVGVVSKNDVIAQVDSNISAMESYLEKNENEYALLTEEFEEDYAAKTRTVAMLLEQEDGDYLTNDQVLEELRVTVNADRISVADKEGDIIASTDLSGENSVIREAFQQHLTDTVYTDVLFLLDEEDPIIVAASTLDNGNGMVQITFSADNVVSLLNEADMANAASDIPLYTSGTTAVLDAETLEYISCTDSSRIGETISYDTDLFAKSKGRFDVTDEDGNSAMIRYQTCNGYIVLAIVPYSDIYHMRNIVAGWIACGGLVFLLVTALAIRMGIMRQKKKNQVVD